MKKEIGKYDEVVDEFTRDLNIPRIPFKKNWDVTIIENFGGSVFRFVVKYCRGAISTYLDRNDNLGYYGSPYWEIYPYFDDAYRCDEWNVDMLVTKIEESLYHLNNKDTKSYIEKRCMIFINGGY